MVAMAANTGSTSATLAQVVNTASSGTSLASSTNPSLVGANVTFTATVTGASPTGSVNFKDGASSISGCSAVALPAGSASSKTATCSSASLAAGTHNIVATYGGDSANAGSTSSALAQVVNTASSGTSLASSTNPAVVGTSVTFTATVTGTAPTGSVAFTDGGSTITGCGAVALPAGAANSKTATCSTSGLSAGAHSIVATYGGDAGNNGSTSSTLTQTVNKATSTAAVASSASPSLVGANVTFTATVTGNAPTGSVGFTADGTTLTGCGAVALPAGSASSKTATCSTSGLTLGTHNIVATYGGDAGNSGSTSTTLAQVVNTASSGTSLASSTNPSLVGANVTFTATVTGASPDWHRSALLPMAAHAYRLRRGGPARRFRQLQDRDLQHQRASRVSTHNIVATYGGDAGNSWLDQHHPGAGGQHRLKRYLAGELGQSVAGRRERYLHRDGHRHGADRIGQLQGRSITITGCAAVALPAGSANSKTATCSTSSLSAGSHNIVGTYGGDSGNAGSTSSTLAQVVNIASSGTSLASSANPALVGTSVTFTATVTGNAPTGSVGFTADGTTLSGCGAVALPAGAANPKTATCSTAA